MFVYLRKPSGWSANCFFLNKAQLYFQLFSHHHWLTMLSFLSLNFHLNYSVSQPSVVVQVCSILWPTQLFLLLLLLFSVWLFVTPWTTACQAPLSSTISQSLFKFMCIEAVMLSNHLILCLPLLLPLSSIFPSIRVFSNDTLQLVARVLEVQLQHQSFQWIFRVHFL